ncbi:hypothetical protein QOT17_007209 [Balamuthia mandrillaris]
MKFTPSVVIQYQILFLVVIVTWGVRSNGAGVVTVSVASSSSCSSSCLSAGLAYADLKTAIQENWNSGIELVFELQPGAYELPIDLGNGGSSPSKLSFIGKVFDRSEVVMKGCVHQPPQLYIRSLTMTESERCSSDGFLTSTNEVRMEDVHVRDLSKKGLVLKNNNFWTRNVRFSNVSQPVVNLASTAWQSEGFLIIEDSKQGFTNSFQTQHFLTKFTQPPSNLQQWSYQALDGKVKVLCYSETTRTSVIFEGNQNAVWMREAHWTQWGAVAFVKNTPVAYQEAGSTEPLSQLVSITKGHWKSSAPVHFLDNTVESTSALMRMTEAGLTFSYAILLESVQKTNLFSCFSSSLHAFEPCDGVCNKCAQLSEDSKAVIGWDLFSRIALSSSRWEEEKGKELLVDSNASSLTLIRSGATDKVMVINITVDGPGADSISFPAIPPSPALSFPRLVSAVFSEKAQTEEVSFVLSPSAGLPVTFSIQPLEPPFFVSSEAHRVTLITASSLSLPELNVRFPSSQPEVLCIPSSASTSPFSAASSSSSTSASSGNDSTVLPFVLAQMKRLVEKTAEGDPLPAKAQDLTALDWAQQQTSNGAVLFSANISFSAWTDLQASVQLAFSSAVKGSKLLLEDGESTIKFQQDSLKWSLIIKNWPFSSAHNVLVLETTLRTGEERWLEVKEVLQKASSQQWKLRGTLSEACFRALLWSWVDGRLDAPQPVQVTLDVSAEDAAAVDVRFYLPYFEEELRYDPDLSVLMNGNDGGEGERDRNGGEGGLWWKIAVPVAAVVAVALIVAVPVVLLLVQRHRKAMTVKQLEVVNC